MKTITAMRSCWWGLLSDQTTENLRSEGATVRGAKVQSEGARVRSDGPKVSATHLRTVAPSYCTVAPSPPRPIGPSCSECARRAAQIPTSWATTPLEGT